MDETLGETIALKFLPAAVARDAVSVDELKDETRRARRLRHANIVSVFGFEPGETTAAISMELIDGSTLAQLSLRQPGNVFSVEALTPLRPQICSALDYSQTIARIAQANAEATRAKSEQSPREDQARHEAQRQQTEKEQSEYAVAVAKIDELMDGSAATLRASTEAAVNAYPATAPGKLRIDVEGKWTARLAALEAARLALARSGLNIKTTPTGADVRMGALAADKSPLLMCDAMLAELCCLLAEVPGGVAAVCDNLASGAWRLDFPLATEHARVFALMDTYADELMSLADACLEGMAELHVGATVFTLDGHFRVYRKNRRQLIPVIMPPDIQ